MKRLHLKGGKLTIKKFCFAGKILTLGFSFQKIYTEKIIVSCLNSENGIKLKNSKIGGIMSNTDETPENVFGLFGASFALKRSMFSSRKSTGELIVSGALRY